MELGYFNVSILMCYSFKKFKRVTVTVCLCISQFHQLPAPPPGATAGHLPALLVPGMGHLQILHCPGAPGQP